jgi:3-isopropylmalate/(R)-2-methylmalate dehydratase small subunit
MEPFIRLEGVAAPMPIDNVDTDAIIPSRESSSVARTGYGEKLFSNWRYHAGGREPNPDFVLNRPPFDAARILVAGRNFGCGSSREAAVWSLQQFGVRCVVAESFGLIFRNNCIRNGLAPIALDIAVIEGLLDELNTAASPVLAIDLVECTVRAPGGAIHGFEIGGLEREMLLKGADQIAVTLDRADQIAAFQARDRASRPWVYARPDKSAS